MVQTLQQPPPVSPPDGTTSLLSLSLLSLLDSHPDSFYILDKEHRLLYLNKAAQQRNEELHQVQMSLGDIVYNHLPALQRREMKKHIKRVFAGEQFSVERRLRLPGNAGEIWLSIRYQPLVLQSQKQAAVCVQMRDMTAEKRTWQLEKQQKEMAKALRQSRELFAAFMEGSPALSWITDKNGVMLYMNEPMMNVFHFEKKDIGKSIFVLFNEELAMGYHQNNCKAIQEGLQTVQTEQAVQPDGSIRTYKTIKFPVLVNGEVMAGGWGMDISDQKVLEQQLVNFEVQKKNEILQTVLAAQEKERREIAYELHENIAQVLATANQLVDFAESGREANQSAQSAIKKAINELRSVSNWLNPFSIEQLTIEEVLQHYLASLPKTGCRYTVHITGDETGLKQLKQCIVRLLQKCIRNIYQHSGATEAMITVAFDTVIFIEVSDNGKGFDITKEETGLGFRSMLYRTQYVKGTMEVSSSDKGTTLQFKIPFCTL